MSTYWLESGEQELLARYTERGDRLMLSTTPGGNHPIPASLGNRVLQLEGAAVYYADLRDQRIEKPGVPILLIEVQAIAESQKPRDGIIVWIEQRPPALAPEDKR
jgi:hypothetical protein